ncbi:MAG: hypothetical protein H7A35_00040 [Planctomycetales bacterium]|nr:hypothetical protein [bacterium]UNM08456.1 MAG: hypothetical protein H7A35_00040 [Planctomycetales bacterium]
MNKLLLAFIASVFLLATTSAQAATAVTGFAGSLAAQVMQQGQPLSEREIDPKTYVVYVTKTGKKYHMDGCQYLRKSKIKTTLADARKAYEPCKVCKPPK